ncbi:MAG: hypothetical protein UW22_C0003G0017 [Candidatus Gottesmanbacteria bacterium GW2011_GWB1_44_11c]|uniref:YYY membrane protein n=2 Tax=Candidatus Gottesmaniibacteriota TaxID=1752720 RepID=A0A0G1IQG6_9BACT|nr:MAG: hypothetical protein UW22_C0003G0017 [Candidatus Gottesmanbacteria bacterium GW2011_GWB1_44_11c]KKT61400.1 MAG: hypothetical protein UW52_C0004G0012 [Candidatus Gottesmanbacteria bacterium GW2011_GWA1_44_24b]HCM81765.1 hypothetical protein [Patescibacteria group bacterium]
MVSNVFLISLFALYSLVTYWLGFCIIQKLMKDSPIVFRFTAAYLIGVGVSIPLTYLFSCLLSVWSSEPILWGTIATLMLCFILLIFFKKIPVFPQSISGKNLSLSDIFLVIFSFAFSFWMMGKSFRGSPDGQLFVAGNAVFDFGHMVGIIRSISWGSNIPIMSPFFAGEPFLYHFFFPFWIALWEYFGIPIVPAVTIPSSFSFASLLIMIYYVAQMIGKRGKLVGWLAVFLTLTHSTLTFWHLLFRKGISLQFLQDIWRLPSYPFAGPFDGSVISIFTTLNPYVNQRHLAYAAACGILLIVLVGRLTEEKRLNVKTGALVGSIAGLLFFWNITVSLLTGLYIIMLFLLKKTPKTIGVFVLCSIGVITVYFLPFFPHWNTVLRFLELFYKSRILISPAESYQWSWIRYFWENLGILPIVALFGFFILPKKFRYFFLPSIGMVLILCFFAVFQKTGFDQKFFSFSIIWINILAAIALAGLWKKGWLLRIMMVVLICILTVSGAADLMVIKNDFAFPLVSKDLIPVLFWVKNNTPKDAVFVSYADIIDPVALAGRKNYYGFFGNAGSTDRSLAVKDVYAGDVKTARILGVSYILAPKGKKSDFPYAVDALYFQEHAMNVYEDGNFVIYSVVK